MGYQIMFYGGLALAAICLVLAIWLFIKLDIKQALADLTGSSWLKSKQPKSFHYQADLTESGKRTTSQIVLRKDQAAPFTTGQTEETELLQAGEPVNVQAEAYLPETELLSDDEDATTLLTNEQADFIVEDDFVITDAEEVISNGGEKIG
ncbi:hypothetical protein SAMN04488134_109144 [Amphibacillus marinus]|uniref:Uncharacterized protein n=1 Tax=Amphibacillus marinus TaxID=872970 RepID=A0A1H8R4R3_9BACI|nr:hypothetical protein [Amphibacillus marinus]SEO61124.1 hypothetical protein SAMN04488134_109144 [Amphibacillus marinus]